MSYSFKNFTGQNLQSCTDLDGQEIRGSCFSQEKPDTHIFPETMHGVVFLNCNLDNVFIPEGNMMVNCSARRFQAQEDGLDWEIDEQNLPIKILGT